MTDTETICRPTIPTAHARSWLLVSAANPAAFLAAHGSAADAIVYDLEDGVLPHAKPAARIATRNWLSTHASGWVRINDATTTDFEPDLYALADLPGLQGVVLAKCESVEHVDRTRHRLPQDTPIVALIESALGIERAYDIASAQGVSRLAFGTGDFRRDTGTTNNTSALAYARGRLVVASAAAGIAAPIDGPTLGVDTEPLESDLTTTRALGMTGKLTLAPEHTLTINSALSPYPADLTWATEVIDHLGANGQYATNGSDLPKLAQAQRIRNLATIFATE